MIPLDLYAPLKTVLLDGAMGTMLQARGLPTGALPEVLNRTAGAEIRAIHRSYLEAGSRILYTNTFGANPLKLAGSGYSTDELVRAGVSCARQAAADYVSEAEKDASELPLVALDVGPLGELLEPNGQLPFDRAVELFAEVIRAGAAAGCDLVVIETMTDLNEARAAVLAAKENCRLPIFLTMSYEANGRTFTGSCPAAQAALAEGMGVAATGMNCSLGPAEILPLIRELSIYTDLPLIVKANAGLPDPATGRYTVTAEQFAAHAADLAAAGVAYLGGCCGTDPTFISAVKAAAGDRPVPARAVPKQHILCSTPSKVLTSEGLLVVGERINPTGKPRFQEALRKNDLDYICRTALEQEAAGADLLDVNVGIPEINEAEFLREAIPAIQSVCPLPLQIDSADPAALEVGLRIYNGKALVNSVNGKQEQLTAVLPLVRRYGAAVIGLTLDETGIPDTAEGRLAIARRIVAACEQEGISRADLVIDCLALTVSAQPEGARETLRAIRLIREELGVKTILGISNISFGLPERGLINRSFLSMAAGSGLDLAILNPNDRDMMDTVAAARLLQQQDANGARFIARFAGDAKTKATVPDLPEPQVDLEQVLAEAVEKGLPAQAATATERLVGQIALQEIIDRILIPALDRVGEAFENGRIFLPQLIQSANAARKAFDCLRDHMRTGDRTAVNRGDILIATVEGDIHDIGKNIVKAILENYGYRVIDLGKNVPVETVVQKAIEEDVHLIGLSALMTTTLHNMARTIQALRKSGHPCKIMVGGAVLTPDYAEQIGADFYAKDAKASVDIAKIFFAEEEETDK